MNTTKWLRRGAAVLAFAGATVLAVSACGDTLDELLEVENPERILEGELDDPKLVEILVNSVVGEFQGAYADPFIWRGSMFTDEQITGVNWEATARLSQRIVRYDEGDADLMFSDLSAARAMADTVAGRFRAGLIESPSTDERMALVLAYGGYSYILLGDAMCEATVNLGAELYQPTDLYGFAVDRLEEALQIATAAGADDIANLARVGLARAHLNLGNAADVMTYASAVPEDFVYWVEYSDADPAVYNTMYTRVTGGNHTVGVHPHFLNGTFGDNDLVATQTDPRIQHTVDWSLGHNALTKLYKPYQSLPYSGYNGETIADGGEPILYEQGTDIALASGLEALHHYYEAAGASGNGPAGTTLDFVNARRAYGNQAAVDSTGAGLMAELREQRGRDLYMGGFRLGDLRRWMRQGVGDFFPKGTHPTTEWGSYGDATCFPLPLEEYEGNPNLTKPGS